VYSPVRYLQSTTGGSDIIIYDEVTAPTGDISLRVDVTPDARALADKVIFDFIEVDNQSSARSVTCTANAFVKAKRIAAVTANAIILAEGQSVESYTKSVTANAIIQGSGLEWETVYIDGDTWLQKVAD
jgi:hypothetical protein